MRLTIKHRYDFGQDAARLEGSLRTPTSWDALYESEGDFGLPGTREAWEASSERPDVLGRASVIAEIIRALGAHKICSYGVGAARLERRLNTLVPSLELICTESAPRTVRLLRRLFPEATLLHHDLRRDPPIECDLHLFHLIESEFSNDELGAILARFYEPILLVTTTLGLKTLVWELQLRLRSRNAIEAGYVRTKGQLRSLWSSTHTDEEFLVYDRRGFLLRRR